MAKSKESKKPEKRGGEIVNHFDTGFLYLNRILDKMLKKPYEAKILLCLVPRERTFSQIVRIVEGTPGAVDHKLKDLINRGYVKKTKVYTTSTYGLRRIGDVVTTGWISFIRACLETGMNQDILKEVSDQVNLIKDTLLQMEEIEKAKLARVIRG